MTAHGVSFDGGAGEGCGVTNGGGLKARI
jgi:hypothetical protein